MAQHPEPPPPCPDRQNTRTQRRSRHSRHCSLPRLESPPGKQGGDNSDKTTTTTSAAAPTDTTRTTRKECTQEHPLSWIQFHGMKIQQWLNPNESQCPYEERLHKICATTRGFTCQRIHGDHLSMFQRHLGGRSCSHPRCQKPWCHGAVGPLLSHPLPGLCRCDHH